jgi:sigma-E factor negative regulatory protein RseC
MPEQPYIQTQGLVTDCRNNRVKILITGHAACSGCQNGLCMLADAKSHYVEVQNRIPLLHAGDEVIVRVKPSSAYRATLWLYGVPFVAMLFVLILLTDFGWPEHAAGLASLGVLVPYYALLYIMRKMMGRPCAVDVLKR